VTRNQGKSSWITKALLYALSATIAGVIAGLGAGMLGRALSQDVRTATATLLALVALALAFAELAGRRVRLIQFNRETPQRWLHYGPMRWATLNGAALGTGAGSRLGFWLWYVIPLAGLLSADPLLGALVWGAYGLARATAATLMILAARERGGVDAVGLWLVRHNSAARRAAAAELAVLAVAVAVTAGV
jgi:hypothetical protein